MIKNLQCLVYIFLISVLILTACADEDGERGPLAFIRSVEVVDDGGDYIAEIEGDYPDTCSTTGDIEQELEGQSLIVTVYTEQNQDAICEPELTPFSDDIVLEVAGLAAGQYTVAVNGTVASMTLLSDQ